MTKENTVEIEGDKGTKTSALYNASGRAIRKKTMKLTSEERSAILGNVFVPGLFKKTDNAVALPKKLKTRRASKGKNYRAI